MARSKGSGKGKPCSDSARHGYHKAEKRERAAIVQAIEEFPDDVVMPDPRPLSVAIPKPQKRSKGRKWKNKFQ